MTPKKNLVSKKTMCQCSEFEDNMEGNGKCLKCFKPLRTPPSPTGWEAEFDERFSVFDGSQKIIKHVTYSVWIKDFIQKLLLSARTDERKKEQDRWLNQSANAHDERIRKDERKKVIAECLEAVGEVKDDKKFQKWAIKTYVRNYYEVEKTKFVKICRPKKVAKTYKGIPPLNFDAEYYNSEFNERWKINFLIANCSVKKVLASLRGRLKGGI